MSTELCLKCPTCLGHTPTMSFTVHLGAMWQEAGVHEALLTSDGRRAGDFIEALAAGLADMEARPDAYRALEWTRSPRWEDYDDALEFLQGWLALCRQSPDSTILG